MKKIALKQSGFSLIEAMVTIAILVITAYLAVPSITSMYATNEVEAAQQDVVQSFRKAKQFARSVNTTISVVFTLNQKDNTISFALPDGTNQLPDGIILNTVELPGNVAVSSGNATYGFNALGIVDNANVLPGVITLTSGRDANMTRSVTLLNLLGQLQVD